MLWERHHSQMPMNFSWDRHQLDPTKKPPHHSHQPLQGPLSLWHKTHQEISAQVRVTRPGSSSWAAGPVLPTHPSHHCSPCPSQPLQL